MRESDIRKALKKRVEEYGGEVRAVSWLGRKHAPDVFCMFPFDDTRNPRTYQPGPWLVGSFFVETKAPKGKPTAGQLREHKRMRAAMANVLVITTLEELDTWFPPSN